jgi:hypothetical protein
MYNQGWFDQWRDGAITPQASVGAGLESRQYTPKLCVPFKHYVVYQWRNLSIWHHSVLSGGPNTQPARQTPKYRFLVGHVCCIRNIPQYRLSPAEYRQSKLPSSYHLHHLVLRHLSQVVKNPPCSGFEPGTFRTRVRRSNHYTIELFFQTLYLAL